MSTPRQRAALGRYTDRLRHLLGLDHWHLTIASASEARSEAGTFIVNDADEAELYVPERFWTHPPDVQRVTVTHELLHLHFDRALLDYDAAVRKVVPDWMADGLEATPRRIQERAIERFAQAVAPNLPLPKLPAGGEESSKASTTSGDVVGSPP